MTAPLLEVAGVGKRFGRLSVLDDVSFSIAPGEAFGIVGPNGAGKSTLLNVVNGVLRPDAGSVRFDGADVTRAGAAARCRAGIGRSYQIPRPFGGMTVFENALVAASFGGGHTGRVAADCAYRALETAGLAALVGGALSMALGEYVSVSSQRDAQNTLIAKERLELATEPEAELDELTGLYEARGLTPATARQVAVELTEHDALGAHLSAELNLSEDDVVSAGHAAFASAVSFLVGGLVPFLAVVLLPVPVRVPLTFVAVLLALALTGWLSARVNDTPRLRPTARLVVGGAVALVATFAIGSGVGALIG